MLFGSHELHWQAIAFVAQRPVDAVHSWNAPSQRGFDFA
jgi:hypothetical protein